MTPRLPTDTNSQKIGRIGAHMVAPWIEHLGYIWRPGEQSTDFGSDGELELEVRNGSSKNMSVLNRVAKVQIKTLDSAPEFTDGRYKISVKNATRNYWTMSRLPVIVFLVHVPDPSKASIYWSIPPSILQPDDQKTSQIVFLEGDSVLEASEDFKHVVLRLTSRNREAGNFDLIPHMLQELHAIRSDPNFNSGPASTEGIESRLGTVYRHALEIVNLIGDGRTSLLTFDHWRAMSFYQTERFHPEDVNMLDKVAEMAILYLCEFYGRALKIVQEILTEEILKTNLRLALLVETENFTPDKIDEFMRPYEDGTWPDFRSVFGDPPPVVIDPYWDFLREELNATWSNFVQRQSENNSLMDGLRLPPPIKSPTPSWNYDAVGTENSDDPFRHMTQ